MRPIDFIPVWYYGTYYNMLFLVLCWSTVLYYIGSNGQKVLKSEGSPMQGVALLLTIILSLYIGLRPDFYGDMAMYTHSYNHVINDYVPMSFSTEWFWVNLNAFCKKMGMNVYEFDLVVATIYYMGMFLCLVLLTRKNLWIGVLFFYMSFSCFSYGTNGIRNGFACSIDLIAISLLATGGNKRLPVVLFFMFLALGAHRSTMLPSAAALASAFFIKDTKTAIRFWIASIVISLAAGSMVEQFFASLGFDDRMTKYSSAGQNEQSMSQFSHTGFRFDFLFYSMWPVVMVWYVTRYRKFTDRTFTILANTYILSNAFWIMVIRAAFSNRFAYLSWFIYPIVMAYPLLRMNLWKDQDRKTALLLFLYTGFSFFMFFIFYFGEMTGFRGFNLYWWRN